MVKKYTKALTRGPKTQVVNTKNGAYIRSNFHLFDKGGDWLGMKFTCCGYGLNSFGTDCVGPMPQFSYIELMDRTWVWISSGRKPAPGAIPKLKATPTPSDTSEDIPTDPDSDTDTDKENDADQENDTDQGRDATQGKDTDEDNLTDDTTEGETEVPRKLLYQRVEDHYTTVQLEARDLTKRRRELRKRDPLNMGPDSSDDSIDENMAKRLRTSSGVRPRKSKNKRNRTYKLADGRSKRLYPCSDSERDAGGHDPTGNARTAKRARASNSKKNFTSYIQRGPARGRQSRNLIIPVDTLLATSMPNRQQLTYQAPFYPLLKPKRGTFTTTPLTTKINKNVTFDAPNTTRIRFRNRVNMTKASPIIHTEAFPWNESPIENICIFNSLDDFLKALLKGNNWEQWYPALVRPTYIVIESFRYDSDVDELIFNPLDENEFNQLKTLINLAPRHTILIEIVKDYESKKVSRPPLFLLYG